MTNVNAPAAGHAISMSNAAAAGRIEEDYASSAAYQHAIEIVRNALQQPGTSQVTLDIVALPGTGALKRMIANNGPHMPKDVMERYMTTIGEGDGALWRLDNTLGNRHAGARTSVLPFTDVGILSWDAGAAPDGLYMRLYKDPIARDYRYTSVTTPDPALLALLTKCPGVLTSGHGVGFIYLGRDEHIDGPFMDSNPSKGETETGISDALRDRIFAAARSDGASVTLTVNTPMPDRGNALGGRKLTGVSGKEYRLDGRVIKGHDDWVRKPCESGTVDIDPVLGVKAHWTLLPYKTDPVSRHLPFGGKGHILVRYKNESMVLAAPGGDYPELSRVMRFFGVQLADVYSRLSLVIEGPTDPGVDPANPQLHLHQDPSRSRVMMSNGKDLPLEAWGTSFIEKMPAAIATANKEARERIGSRGRIKLSTADRLRARLDSRLKLSIPSRRRKAGTGVLGPSGKPGTDYLDGLVGVKTFVVTGIVSDTGEPGIRARGRKPRKSKRKGVKRQARIMPTGNISTRRMTPASEGATEVQPRRAPVPQPVPISESDWLSQEFNPEAFAVWDHAAGCVYFNLGHPIYHSQVAYFTGEWLDHNPKLRGRVTADDVSTAVHESYEEDTIGRILHYVARHGLTRAKTDLSDLNLTIAAHGFENVEEKIERHLRTAASRGVVKVGVASPARPTAGVSATTTATPIV